MTTKLFPEMENEKSYIVLERFVNNSTKEEFADKILEICQENWTDFEKLTDISAMCEILLGKGLWRKDI